jgi:tripartite-type tricarboxylate transporter receptor subunit TctC
MRKKHKLGGNQLRFLKLTAAAVVASFAANAAVAEDKFPSDTINIIVQYGAGGGTDSFVRTLEKPLEDAFGVDVAVHNISGGGGAVGMTKALAAKADGYTVTIPNNAFYTLVGMGNVSFGLDDFDYLAALVVEPYVLTVAQSDRWSDLASFVEASKEKPVRIGFSGVGSSTHIMTLAIAKTLGVDVQFIPYGGGSEATAAALGGHIDAVVLQPSDVASAIQGENGLKPVATTGDSSLLDGVPTFSSAGYDLTVQQWRGIAAPAGVPEDAKMAWEAALKQAIQDPAFVKAAGNIGVEISPLFGADLKAFVDNGESVMVPLTKEVAQNK